MASIWQSLNLDKNMRKSDKLVIKKTKPMCDEGMNAYDSFIKKGNTPQQANKLASKLCNELGDKATYSKKNNKI